MEIMATSKNYGKKKGSDHFRDILNPYGEKPNYGKIGRRRRLSKLNVFFFHNSVGYHNLLHAHRHRHCQGWTYHVHRIRLPFKRGIQPMFRHTQSIVLDICPLISIPNMSFLLRGYATTPSHFPRIAGQNLHVCLSRCTAHLSLVVKACLWHGKW